MSASYDFDPDYKPKPDSTLILTLELDYKNYPQILKSDQHSHDEALKTTIETIKLIKNITHCKVIRKEIDDSFLEFNKVHSMPKPNETNHFPIVIEIFYPTQNSKRTVVFGHVRINLLEYDGLTGVNSFLNIMEYLENKFTNLNRNAADYMTGGRDFSVKNKKPNPGLQPILTHLLSLIYQLFINIITLCMCIFTYPNGPLAVAIEPFLKERIQMKYTDINIDFLEIVNISQNVQNLLSYPYVVYTVNYAPEVALGKVSNFKEILDRQHRMNGILTPPGHPLPNGLVHALIISNGMFWNNYGKFQPNISADIKGVLWEWTRFSRCFAPLVFVITIKSKLFVCTNMPEMCHNKTKHLFSGIGSGECIDLVQFNNT